MNRKPKLMAVALATVMGSASIVTGADTSFKPWYLYSNYDKANSTRKDQVKVQANGSSFMPWYQGGYATQKAKSEEIKTASRRNANEG